METKLAEAKLAQAKRAAEMNVAVARPAVETHYLRDTETRYTCDSCGTVTSVASRFLYGGTNVWEVRVNFGGASRVFVYSSDPGLANGERVRLAAGRLMRG